MGEPKATFIRQIQNPNLDYLRRKIIHKKLIEASKKISFCPNCGTFNGKMSNIFVKSNLMLFLGVVKKAVGAVLKIAHAEPITQDNMTDFEYARNEHKELNSLIPSSKFNLLDPLKVLNIFRRINDAVRFLKKTQHKIIFMLFFSIF